ncbi:MAG: hypothetical protein U0798_04580 [Gemmataceae bacterium]
MRHLLGMGMAFVGTVGVSFAQQPLLQPKPQQPPQEQATVPGLMPAFRGAPTPSANSVTNAPPVTLRPLFEMPKLEQPKPKPGWELKPEHGEWFVEIKSYGQIDSGLMAEALATEVRDLYKVPVYLYEWGSEARKKREEEEALARKRIEEEIRPFVELQARLKAEAEARGEVFEPEPIRTKVPVYYREIPDQYMVVVGGYKDIDTARKALNVIRTWPMPKDNRLLDRIERSEVQDGKKVWVTNFINPYTEAKIVRNMTLPKQQVSVADEFLIKLNQYEPLSIMKSNKKWTLKVKTFNTPVTKGGAESDSSGTGRGPSTGLGAARPGQWLDATAQQAQDLCKVLRNIPIKGADGKTTGINAFVLHHRTGSMVTVGEYDSMEDPKMQQDLRQLQSISFMKSENKNGQVGSSLGFDKQVQFEGIYPIVIPK